jgi:hypothetical protein
MNRKTIAEICMVAALFLIAFGMLTALFGAFSKGYSIVPSSLDRLYVTAFGCVVAAVGFCLAVSTIYVRRDDL